MRDGLIIAAIAILLSGNAAAQTAPPATPTVTELPPVEVVGASPLVGSGIDRNTIPAETHVLDSSDLTRQGTTELVNSLNRQVSGVSLDSASGNPYQPTLFYHGFAASGLQWTPQGLAVYVNGVRFNQPFGDTVDWDLIPNIAIDSLNIEGSNPVFGLNALGGSINVQLRNGFTYHGFEADLWGGSFGQVQGEFQYGKAAGHSRACDAFREDLQPPHGKTGRLDFSGNHGRLPVVFLAWQHSRVAELGRTRGDPFARRRASQPTSQKANRAHDHQ